MIIPNKLKKGDTIGVVAPSNPIVGDNIEEIMKAKEMVEKDGFKIEFSKNLFSNTCGYSSTAKEKAEDINYMFSNKNIKMIWCAKGGENSNSTFEYLDYNLIEKNPKIICGYSDITSITNIITAKTGLVTFSGTNFIPPFDTANREDAVLSTPVLDSQIDPDVLASLQGMQPVYAYVNNFGGFQQANDVRFIFYDPAHVELRSVLDLPKNQQMRGVKALPNDSCPSDHVPLLMVADLLEEQRVCERVSPTPKSCRPTLTQPYFQRVYI